MSQLLKIALGVGCGLVLAAGALFVTCTACVGVGIVEQQEREKKALAQISIHDLSDETRSDYMYINGSARNDGPDPVDFVKVEVQLLDAGKNVLHSEWTYAVDSQALAPGASRKWQIMTQADSRYKSYSARVIP